MYKILLVSSFALVVLGMCDWMAYSSVHSTPRVDSAMPYFTAYTHDSVPESSSSELSYDIQTPEPCLAEVICSREYEAESFQAALLSSEVRELGADDFIGVRGQSLMFNERRKAAVAALFALVKGDTEIYSSLSYKFRDNKQMRQYLLDILSNDFRHIKEVIDYLSRI